MPATSQCTALVEDLREGAVRADRCRVVIDVVVGDRLLFFLLGLSIGSGLLLLLLLHGLLLGLLLLLHRLLLSLLLHGLLLLLLHGPDCSCSCSCCR